MCFRKMKSREHTCVDVPNIILAVNVNIPSIVLAANVNVDIKVDVITLLLFGVLLCVLPGMGGVDIACT